MPISITTVDHFSITVSDLDRSLHFYRDLLGMQEVERHRLVGEGISKMAGKPGVDMQVVRLAAPETPTILLDLQQYISPIGKVSTAQLGDVAHSHLCFGIADVDQAYGELSAKGVAFVSEPVIFDLGWGIVRVVFLKDPDGYVLELNQVPVEVKSEA